MSLPVERIAQADKRRLEGKRVNNTVKHGKGVVSVAACLEHAYEQVDGALLHGAYGLAVAHGVVEADNVEVPDVGY